MQKICRTRVVVNFWDGFMKGFNTKSLAITVYLLIYYTAGQRGILIQYL